MTLDTTASSQTRQVRDGRILPPQRTTKGHTMSTELTTISNRTVPGTNVSPWREAVNDEAGASFGAFLKFAKGDWLLGEEGKKVSEEARFVTNMHEYYRGWVRKPAFRIVDWAYWDDETAADPDGALQLQHAAEMDDEIL